MDTRLAAIDQRNRAIERRIAAVERQLADERFQRVLSAQRRAVILTNVFAGAAIGVLALYLA